MEGVGWQGRNIQHPTSNAQHPEEKCFNAHRPPELPLWFHHILEKAAKVSLSLARTGGLGERIFTRFNCAKFSYKAHLTALKIVPYCPYII